MTKVAALQQTERNQHYARLDELRGAASIVVLLYHASTVLGAPRLFPHGYLAVDFFFVLSGFVIANGYTERLAHGGLRPFLRARARRLLPLSMLGVAVGTLLLCVSRIARPGTTDGLASILAASALNLALLPKLWAGAASHFELFPSDTVLWSLSLEMLVNIAWAMALASARAATLAGVASVAAVLMAVFAHSHGSLDGGWSVQTYYGGVARATFGFLAGVLIWRFRPRQRRVRFVPAAMVALLALLFASTVRNWMIDMATATAAFPAALWIAVACERRSAHPTSRWLADLSYPLYAIHFPVLVAIAEIRANVQARPPGWSIYACVLPIVAGALLLQRCYDAPVRAWLAGPHRAGRGGPVLATETPGVSPPPRAAAAPHSSSARSPRVQPR